MSALPDLIDIITNTDCQWLDTRYDADASPTDIAEQVYAAISTEVIAYARSLGKPVQFTHPQVDPDRGLPPTGHCTRHTGAERELYGCSGPDPADASADRLPFLGDVDARVQASADKLRGLLGGGS